MNYETEIINGHKAVVRHIFKPEEIKVGSKWIRADGSGGIVTVEGVNQYGSMEPWTEVEFSWDFDGEKVTHAKDAFSFQCRYLLIVEDEE